MFLRTIVRSHSTTAPLPRRTSRPRPTTGPRPRRSRRAVSATRLRRSVLAVPGSNPRMMEKAAASAADEVFLDLEDACAPLEKPAARAKVVEALRSHDWHGKTRVVRINQVTSEFAFDDLRDVVTQAAEGLMRGEEIAFASHRLETITYGPADFSASMQLPSLTVGNTYNYPGDI